MGSKQISDITTEQTSAAGNEWFESELSDGSSAKIKLSTISNYIGGDPIGTIKDWHKSMTNTPSTLPATFKECDGTVVSDADSVYNTYRVPNLNGANVVLTLTWTADAGGAYATVAATDITALAEGDDVTGSGIAANSYISDITGTTVTITDTAATGSISSTFTNDGKFVRGGSSSGVGQKDQMQKLTGKVNSFASTYGLLKRGDNSLEGAFSQGTDITNSTAGNAILGAGLDFDSSDSPDARTSSTTDGETRPANTTMVKIMKIK